MSAGDRLVPPRACSWCSHPQHAGLCHQTVDYTRDPKKPKSEPCRCQVVKIGGHS